MNCHTEPAVRKGGDYKVADLASPTGWGTQEIAIAEPRMMPGSMRT